MTTMTEAGEKTPVRIPDDEMPVPGGPAFFVFGVILGLMATFVLGMLFLMQNDPLGPEARRLVATTEAPVAPGDPVSGEAVYASTCATCHGAIGEGVTGLGLPLDSSEFVHSTSDAQLVAFIKEGRDASHPDNTTGVAMPPKGGNPSLTDEDLADVVAFLRTLR